MKEFIFSAKNKEGKDVTERIEAENLGQARYTLECRGYEAISFHTNDLTHDVYEMHGERAKRSLKKVSPEFIKEAHKGGLVRVILLLLRNTWHLWSIIFLASLFLCFMWGISLLWAFLPIAILMTFTLYLQTPTLFFTELTKAENMADWPQVRKWVKILSVSNKINIGKIPDFWLDTRLAYADTADGNLVQALNRIKKYENDPKVAKAFYYTSHAGIYSVMSDKEKLLEYRKLAMEHSGNRVEETLDYAIGLARFKGQTDEARMLINQVYEGELTELNSGSASFAMGVVECEERNYDKAQFHFERAKQQLLANADKNLLGGLFNAIDAYSVLIYANRGEYDKAEESFNATRPYLIAHKETELLERCERALA